ncbi:hypothetical protein [Rhizobium sp. BK176]|uniref:hypothetical protein n=1 Tax=Rhizobium sp. BK176 TaxID=2587071 RepID=UPI0021695084|nr:hypothetical protein [Rhizobium sp. BK176]MCS4089288.1 hypothetical protein [Rhizobium sp. BK176]
MNPLRHMSFARGFASVTQSFPDTEENRSCHLERALLREIEDAVDGLSRTLKEVSCISVWNFDELEHRSGIERRAGQSKWYRKPKLILDSTVTKKGNLCVTWRPAEGYERDTIYGPYHYNAKAAFERPQNEVLIIRKFARAADIAEGSDHYGTMDRERLCKIVDLVRLLIEHARELLSISCDVELGETVKVNYPVEESVVGKIEPSENPKSAGVRDLSGVDKRIEEAFLERYGITAATLVGFVWATRRYRMPIAVMAQLLHDHHGMKAEVWTDGFQKLVDENELRVMCSQALKRVEIPFKGTPLPALKELFAKSFPDRKSWHVGTFEPTFP